jgi:hypothetical protein
MCGTFSLIFVCLDVRRLLLPFVSSFPLSSSEVLKIETSMRNRNFPNLKNSNLPKMKNRKLLKMKNRNLPEMRNENYKNRNFLKMENRN